jgi:hypothetical protein
MFPTNSLCFILKFSFTRHTDKSARFLLMENVDFMLSHFRHSGF